MEWQPAFISSSRHAQACSKSHTHVTGPQTTGGFHTDSTNSQYTGLLLWAPLFSSSKGDCYTYLSALLRNQTKIIEGWFRSRSSKRLWSPALKPILEAIKITLVFHREQTSGSFRVRWLFCTHKQLWSSQKQHAQSHILIRQTRCKRKGLTFISALIKC